jgi:hypothetical protein
MFLKKRESIMRSDRFPDNFFYLILTGIVAGCSLSAAETNRHQADIGFGIVEGTKGYRQLQQDNLLSTETMKKIQGQVLRIEGAAYVVHVNHQREIRLPVDENTRIDRPAHVGDWIEAQMDQSGRARLIRNIDDQIILE